ncbi:MAG: hypothetical protein WBG91_17515, partial [Syntrophobacteria bacterium]
LVIEYWNLKFVCDLVLEIWDFINATIPLLQSPSLKNKAPIATSGGSSNPLRAQLFYEKCA